MKKSHHHITINKSARADINWWIDFLPSWSHSTLIPETYTIYPSDLKLSSDACDFGFGGLYGNAWIQGAFEGKYIPHSIDFKELFALVAAVMTWGPEWVGKRIVFYTDNQPITFIWDSGTTPCEDLMTLVRKLFLTAAKFQFSISLKHISVTSNTIADAISRFQVDRIRKLMPTANTQPTPLQPDVWDLLYSIEVPKKKGNTSTKQRKI